VQFASKVSQVCDLYQQTPHLAQQGVHVISTDEMTCIQALERTASTLPVKAGLVERIEFEYIRHGTLSLMCNLEVATGRIVSPTLNPTRTEVDYVDHLARLVGTDPDGTWIILADQLNTHQSAGLVEWVATTLKLKDYLGEKGRTGILKNMASRQIFLSDPAHRISFRYTPKHSSWLNQIEIWFSILVRKLLKRSNNKSVEELRERILAFIGYYNAVLAKPFAWTYKGKTLQV
jgi:hypothetical protein